MSISILAAILITSSPVAPVTTQDASAVSKPVREKKICRDASASGVSRIRQKICRTSQEWEDADKTAKAAEDLKRLSD